MIHLLQFSRILHLLQCYTYFNIQVRYTYFNFWELNAIPRPYRRTAESAPYQKSDLAISSYLVILRKFASLFGSILRNIWRIFSSTLWKKKWSISLTVLWKKKMFVIHSEAYTSGTNLIHRISTDLLNASKT